MHSFTPGFLEAQSLTHDQVRSIALIAEYKGKEELYRRQSPELLDTLVELREAGEVRCLGTGRGAEWERLTASAAGQPPA